MGAANDTSLKLARVYRRATDERTERIAAAELEYDLAKDEGDRQGKAGDYIVACQQADLAYAGKIARARQRLIEEDEMAIARMESGD